MRLIVVVRSLWSKVGDALAVVAHEVRYALRTLTQTAIDGFFAPNNSKPDKLGPSTFKVTTANGAFTMDVVDDGQNDLKKHVPNTP